MWRSLYPRRFFRSSMHCSSSSSSSSKIPSPYHVPRSLFLSSSNYSSAISSFIRKGPILKRKGCVWWNLENFSVPYGLDKTIVLCHLMGALSAYEFASEINVFGDISQLSTEDRKHFSCISNRFNHIPKGGNITVQSSLMFSLLTWVSQNPPPVHLFFVPPVDNNLDSVLQHLKMNNYNVWLATMKIRGPVTAEERDKMYALDLWYFRAY